LLLWGWRKLGYQLEASTEIPVHELTSFLLLAQKKRSKRRRPPSANCCATAKAKAARGPQAKGIAIRCYPSAIFSYMALVFLAYALLLLTSVAGGADVHFQRICNHIYGEKRRHHVLSYITLGSYVFSHF
jgi:hypothetical protein